MTRQRRVVSYTWTLRKVMAEAGLFATTDLIEPLAERGVNLSASQVHHLAFDDAFLFHPMHRNFPLGPHGVDTVCLQIHLFNNFSGKTGFRIFIAFHVVFIKMLALQLVVKALKRSNIDRPGKAVR